MTVATGIGFVGLGTMGTPMVLNLVKAGTPLVVWNRSQDRTAELEAAGATIARDAAAVFARCRTVILMLANEAANDAVLARGSADFKSRVAGKTIVSMGTMSPDYSRGLGDDIRSASGRYVEAPVSGSRTPAEAGQLVAMLAREPEDVAAVKPLMSPICRAIRMWRGPGRLADEACGQCVPDHAGDRTCGSGAFRRRARSRHCAVCGHSR